MVLQAALPRSGWSSARNLCDLVTEDPVDVSSRELVCNCDGHVVSGSTSTEVHVLASVFATKGGKEEAISLTEKNQQF